MAEFKEVVKKTNLICDEHILCNEECPLYRFDMCCPTDTRDEVNELEYVIMNYELEEGKD